MSPLAAPVDKVGAGDKAGGRGGGGGYKPSGAPYVLPAWLWVNLLLEVEVKGNCQ